MQCSISYHPEVNYLPLKKKIKKKQHILKWFISFIEQQLPNYYNFHSLKKDIQSTATLWNFGKL